MVLARGEIVEIAMPRTFDLRADQRSLDQRSAHMGTFRLKGVKVAPVVSHHKPCATRRNFFERSVGYLLNPSDI